MQSVLSAPHLFIRGVPHRSIIDVVGEYQCEIFVLGLLIMFDVALFRGY